MASWQLSGPLAGPLVVAEPLGTLVVTGKDRLTWLNGLVTANLAPLRPGGGAYGLATSKVGRILSDVSVVVAEDRLIVGCPASRARPLLDALETYLVMEDAELAEAPGYAWLALVGPGSEEAARAAAGAAGGDAAPLDATGLGGAVIAAPEASLGRVREELARAGAEAIGEGDWEALRIERGVPRFGVDFDEKTYPQEARLERRAVSFQKGCYLGQEVVCRLEMRGHVHRRLASFVLAPGAVPGKGAAVSLGTGERTGEVTSAVESRRLGRPIGLCMVKYAASEPGTRLVIDGREAVVCEAPLESAP